MGTKADNLVEHFDATSRAQNVSSESKEKEISAMSMLNEVDHGGGARCFEVSSSGSPRLGWALQGTGTVCNGWPRLDKGEEGWEWAICYQFAFFVVTALFKFDKVTAFAGRRRRPWLRLSRQPLPTASPLTATSFPLSDNPRIPLSRSSLFVSLPCSNLPSPRNDEAGHGEWRRATELLRRGTMRPSMEEDARKPRWRLN
ncbi:hypothetical protein Droror1_Dr00020119 [Drosera rotundifolia]